MALYTTLDSQMFGHHLDTLHLTIKCLVIILKKCTTTFIMQGSPKASTILVFLAIGNTGICDLALHKIVPNLMKVLYQWSSPRNVVTTFSDLAKAFQRTLHSHPNNPCDVIEEG